MNVKVTDFDGFDEMICDSCTLKNDFLNYYSEYSIKQDKEEDIKMDVAQKDINTNVGVIDVNNTNASVSDMNEASTSKSTEKPIAQIEEKSHTKTNYIDKENIENENQSQVATKRIDDAIENIPPSKRFKSNDESTSNIDICIKPRIAKSNKFTGASFWPVEWRTKLCKCSKCLQEYRRNGVEYVLDFEDTVYAYKEKGREKAENNPISLYDETMRELSGMDHVSKIETVMVYNRLKQKLTEFIANYVKQQVKN